MNRAVTVATAVKTAAVLIACTFLYIRFLTTSIPSFLSLTDWPIIGALAAVIVGSTCRLLVHSGTIMGGLAVIAVIAGAIWAEVHFSSPLSHDTVESAKWSSRITSVLYDAWTYGASEVIAIIVGWHLADRVCSKRFRIKRSSRVHIYP